MTDQERVLKGTVLPAKMTAVVGKGHAADAFSALSQIVDVVRESIQIHQTESTKREKLKTYREIEVKRIEAAEKTLRAYFDLTFEERRETNKHLFENLDRARESGDVAALQVAVSGIVEVARTSPLAGIGNLSELRKALDDPDAVFEF
jgi:hypothetical protein